MAEIYVPPNRRPRCWALTEQAERYLHPLRLVPASEATRRIVAEVIARDEAARRREEYRATFEAQERRRADPEFMAWLREQNERLDERLEERHGR